MERQDFVGEVKDAHDGDGGADGLKINEDEEDVDDVEEEKSDEEVIEPKIYD